MLASSNAEALVHDALTRAAALSLDKVLFDGNAADAARPAGLRNGIAALPAASPAATLAETVLADLTALATAVAPIGGPVTFVTAHARAAAMRLRLPANLAAYSVLGSIGVAADAVVAVATDGLASALGGVQIDSKRGSVTVHEATDPVAIGTPGSPATVAAPIRSMFQTDSVASKVRLQATWALRDVRAVAWVEGVVW